MPFLVMEMHWVGFGCPSAVISRLPIFVLGGVRATLRCRLQSRLDVTALRVHFFPLEVGAVHRACVPQKRESSLAAWGQASPVLRVAAQTLGAGGVVLVEVDIC